MTALDRVGLGCLDTCSDDDESRASKLSSTLLVTSLSPDSFIGVRFPMRLNIRFRAAERSDPVTVLLLVIIRWRPGLNPVGTSWPPVNLFMTAGGALSDGIR